MTTVDELRKYYKQLLEASAPDGDMSQPQQPAEQTVDEDAPEIQSSTTADAVTDGETMVAEEKPGPRFPPNPHRFAYQQGEVVSFYDDAGNLVEGTIAGPPVGDRFDVADASGNQHEVLKSELFYPAGEAMAEQPMADQENTA